MMLMRRRTDHLREIRQVGRRVLLPLQARHVREEEALPNATLQRISGDHSWSLKMMFKNCIQRRLYLRQQMNSTLRGCILPSSTTSGYEKVVGTEFMDRQRQIENIDEDNYAPKIKSIKDLGNTKKQASSHSKPSEYHFGSQMFVAPRCGTGLVWYRY